MRYVLLLRAVNVGGHNRVPMAQLREILQAIGHGDVATYIQSGNAVFGSDRADPAKLEREIEQEVLARMGVETSAFVRSDAELAAVVRANPLVREGDVAGVNVSFLSAHPDPDRIAAMDPAAFEPDELHFGDRVLYIRYRTSTRETKLTNAVVERRLGVRQTTRNWNTTLKLLDMVRALPEQE